MHFTATLGNCWKVEIMLRDNLILKDFIYHLFYCHFMILIWKI